MTSQVQRSAASGLRIFGVVQPRTCLKNRKVCSRSKRRPNAQARSTSEAVGGLQPHRLRVAVAGQVVDLQMDQRPLDNWKFTVVVGPGPAVGQPRVQPLPAGGPGGAVTAGVSGGSHL